jgi:hypothetical protein
VEALGRRGAIPATVNGMTAAVTLEHLRKTTGFCLRKYIEQMFNDRNLYIETRTIVVYINCHFYFLPSVRDSMAFQYVSYIHSSNQYLTTQIVLIHKNFSHP